MKYLVTGNAGSGKTSVIEELAKRGYAAYSTDDMDGVTTLTDRRTGKEVNWPNPPIDWGIYSWDWRNDEIEKLLNSDDVVFIGAVVNNQKKFYSRFSKILVLVLDSETLKRRILTRESKNYGKHPEQLAQILDYHEEFLQKTLKEPNSIAIDSTQPLSKVVDEILSYVNEA